MGRKNKGSLLKKRFNFVIYFYDEANLSLSFGDGSVKMLSDLGITTGSWNEEETSS